MTEIRDIRKLKLFKFPLELNIILIQRNNYRPRQEINASLQQSANCPCSLPVPCQHGSGSSCKTRSCPIQIITSERDTVFLQRG